MDSPDFCIEKDDSLLVVRIKEQENEIERLCLCNQLLTEMYDHVRSVKHDFLNVVQALYGYVQLNDIEGIKSIIYEFAKEGMHMNEEEMIYSEAIQDPAIASLLFQKYSIAKDKNVEMTIEIGTSLKSNLVSDYELSRVLSILVDNALEAASNSNEKVIHFQSRYDVHEHQKIIIIENSYENKDVDIHQIFQKGFTTKNNTNEHGLGLWNVKTILSKNDNIELITEKGHFFRQILKMKQG